MNVAVIAAEVVFKPIKITGAWDSESKKVGYDICAHYKEEESGQASRYSSLSRQSTLEKLGEREEEDWNTPKNKKNR